MCVRSSRVLKGLVARTLIKGSSDRRDLGGIVSRFHGGFQSSRRVRVDARPYVKCRLSS